MTRSVNRCPLCGPHPIKTREEFDGSLTGTFAKEKFMNSICDRCFVAIFDALKGQDVIVTFADPKPINEAEQLDGVR